MRYSSSSASPTPATTSVADDLGNYNAVGLATQYTVEVNTDTTAAYNYTNTYKYDYVGFGGSYREARQQASITLPGYTAGTTTTTFDSHGNAIQIDNPNGEPKSQRLIVDAQGRILHKDVTKKDNSVVHQDYAYVNGNPIGSNGDAESSTYDYNYTPISDQYPASNPGQYIVQSSSETLQGIAQSVFGDANLWYLIADANGLSAGATLVAGQALTIPNQVSNLHNDANTFRPYQPNEIIGDTTAAVKAPPPPSHKSNIFATILIAVVVVVVSYFAGPVLGQLVAEGLTALGASAGAAGAIGVAAGTVLGAAAGSAAGQGAGIALGAQDRFSFSAVGRAALTAAVVGGPSSGGGEATTLAGVISEAVVSNVATQGVNIALGQQDRFSFSAVAASALAAGIEVEIGENIPGYNKITTGGLRSSGFSSPAAILGATTKNFVEGVFVRGVQSLVEKGGRINYATIAADSFGNALGNAVVGEIQRPSGERRNPRNGFTSTARYTGPLVGGDIAQLPDSVSNALALNIGSDSIESPDVGPASAPGFTSVTAQRGDSISRLLGTSNPGAIQRFKDLNGITGSSSTIFAGQTYRVPTNLTDFSAEETNGGQATLVADNNRLAQLRAAQDAATAQQTSDIDASSDVPFYLNRNSGPSFVQGPSDPGGFLADQINNGALLRDVVPALAPADRAAYLQSLTGGAVVGPVPEPPRPRYDLEIAFGGVFAFPVAAGVLLGASDQQLQALDQASLGFLGASAAFVGTPVRRSFIPESPLQLTGENGILTNSNRAIIDPNKLLQYALNPDNPVGRNKAIVFNSALGYNQSNADGLLNQLRNGVTQNAAIPGRLDQYGQRFTVDIPITGPNGNTAIVRSGFIFDAESNIPRLTTTYVNN